MANLDYIDRYPQEGAKGIIAEFEEAYLRWATGGYPDDECRYGRIEISHGSSISKQYKGCPQEFFLPRLVKAEREQFETYARTAGLHFSAKNYSNYMRISFSGALKESGLNRMLLAVQKKIKATIPLAQKFYELPLLEDITRRALESPERADWRWDGIFTMNGVHFEDEPDKDGYTYRVPEGFRFEEFGYRPLQNEEELIAFVLASRCRYSFYVQPKDLELEYLRWACVVRDGELRDHPMYVKPQPESPAKSPEPKLKDFF